MIGRDRQLAHGTVRFVDVGEGPVVVLLHGLGGNWRNWEANIPALAASHRVIALDLPGFGNSDSYAGVVTMGRYADTVVELLDVLEVERATVVGNSMGGLLTIEIAVRHPERVESAILVDSGGLPLTSWRHRFFLLPQARVFNRLVQFRLAGRAIVGIPWARRFVGGRILHDPGRIPAELLSSALSGLGAPGFGAALDAGTAYDARDRAPAVACPALILWGREDRLLPPAMGEELHALIHGSRLVVLDDAGHCPMLESPDRFNHIVTGFIAETAAVTS